MEILNKIAVSLEEGNNAEVHDLTKIALNENIAPRTILDDGLLVGMKEVGIKFRANEIFLPEVLLAARAMYAGMDLLKPLFLKDDVTSKGKVVLGTVQGDMHDIGKNLVGIMLKGAGYDIVDVGKDVSPQKFLDTAIAENCSVIGLSALLTTTTPQMKKIIDLKNEQNLSDKIKIIVGGAPVTRELANEIGADAYAYDASSAVDVINEIMGVKR